MSRASAPARKAKRRVSALARRVNEEAYWRARVSNKPDCANLRKAEIAAADIAALRAKGVK